ncbi:hypothetical protein [Secundilactobacillus kimchicus]|nr:hypothetical protein [Secundilactobacillus kimchicus]
MSYRLVISIWWAFVVETSGQTPVGQNGGTQAVWSANVISGVVRNRI